MPPSVVADADVAFALLIHETTSLGGRSGRRQTSHRPDGDLVSPIVMYGNSRIPRIFSQTKLAPSSLAAAICQEVRTPAIRQVVATYREHDELFAINPVAHRRTLDLRLQPRRQRPLWSYTVTPWTDIPWCKHGAESEKR